MYLNSLEVEQFRCHPGLAMDTGGAPWVILAGGNGAGKTSLMEAIYTTVRGHSFRAVPPAELIRAGAEAATVRLESGGDRGHRVGARYEARRKTLHLDGVPVRSLTELAAAVPVDYLGGTGHRLLDGPPKARRRFLDWGLFHVEPQFLDAWRAWHRAHRQRNEWLRRGDYPASRGWTAAVAEHGEALSQLRAGMVKTLETRLQSAPWAVVQGARPRLRFIPGWRSESLEDAFAATTEREVKAGRAVVGPQLDDWAVDFDDLPSARLSRGQAKLASFYLWHARARAMREAGRAAILLADDFLADLDPTAIHLALEALNEVAGQAWLAVSEESLGLELPGEAVRFHVKPGRSDLVL